MRSIPRSSPRTYTIGHKVNSLLFKPSLSTCETWLLPHAWTLHTLRYNQDDHGESKDQGQAWKRKRKKKNGRDRTYPDHPDPQPDDPDQARMIRVMCPKTPEACSMKPEHPDRRPDHPDPRHPDHRGHHPDHPDPACVRDLGRSLCTPSPLTYPFVA